MDEVTGSLAATSNPQVSDLFHDQLTESVQVSGTGRVAGGRRPVT